MKTKKLKLNDLQVKSFVTSFDRKTSLTINGGATNGVKGCIGPDVMSQGEAVCIHIKWKGDQIDGEGVDALLWTPAAETNAPFGPSVVWINGSSCVEN
jgi:hypothetical protein